MWVDLVFKLSGAWTMRSLVSLSYSHTLSLSRSHSLSHTHTPIHTLIHILSVSHSLFGKECQQFVFFLFHSDRLLLNQVHLSHDIICA